MKSGPSHFCFTKFTFVTMINVHPSARGAIPVRGYSKMLSNVSDSSGVKVINTDMAQLKRCVLFVKQGK